MSTDNAQKFRDAWVAFWSPDMATTALALADAMLQQEFRYNVSQPLDAAASTATTHTLDTKIGVTSLAKSFKVVTRANVTADDTNNATIALVYNDGAGGSDTTIATATTSTTGTGNITAGIAYVFPITAANSRIPAGSQVQVKVTKNSSGVALSALSFEFKAAPVA
jgi:hypothetical protein